MRCKRILLTTIFVIIVLIVVAYVILSIYDFSRFKPTISRTVKEATGRSLTMGGDLDVKLGLRLKLSAKDVTFQNAPWGSRPVLATSKRVDLTVALFPLLWKRFEIKRLTLVEPDILIETDSLGRWNLAFEPKKPKEPPGKKQGPSTKELQERPPFELQTVRIRKGRILYRDGQSGKSYDMVLDSLTAEAEGATDPVNLKFRGAFEGTPVKLDATLGSLKTALDPGNPWLVDLSGQVTDTDFTVTGAIRDLQNFRGVTLDVTADGRSIHRVAGVFGISRFPDLGPFSMTGKVGDAGGVLALQALGLQAGTEDTAEFRLEGTMANIPAFEGIDIRFTGLSQDARNLEKLMGQSIPIAGPLRVTGRFIDLSPNLYGLRNLEMALADNLVDGRVGIDLTGQRPRFTAKFESKKLDLRFLFPKGKQKTTTEKPATPSGASPSLQVPDAFDASFVLKAQQILLPWATLSNFTGDTALEGGKITVRAEGQSTLDMSKLVNRGDAIGPVPFSLAAKVESPSGRLSVGTIDFRGGSVELIDFRIQGSVQDLLKLRGANLTFTAQGKEMANLEKLVGRPIPTLGPFAVVGRFRDPSAQTYRMENLELTLGDNKASGWIEANVEGQRPRIRGAFASKSIDIRPFLVMGDEGKSPVTDTIKAPISKGQKRDGRSAGLDMTRTVDVSLDLDVGRLVLPWVTVEKTQTFMLKAGLVFEKSGLALQNLSLEAGAPDLIEVTVKGTVEDLLIPQGMDLHVTMKGSDLANLETILGQSFPFQGEFALETHLADPQTRTYRFSELVGRFDRSDLAGWVELTLSGERPRVRASLKAERFDLRPLLQALDGMEPDSEEPVAPTEARTRVFPDDPLPLKKLRVLDAKVEVQAGQVFLPRVAIDDVLLAMTLEDGHLTVDPLNGVIGGGSFRSRLDLRPVSEAAAVALDLKVGQLDLGAMLEDLGVSRNLEGTLGVEIAASGQGASVAGLMGGLSGQITTVLQNGRISNRSIDLFGGSLFKQVFDLLNPLSQRESSTAINCHVAQWLIKDGLAQSKVLFLDTDYTRVIGHGTIDLKTEKLHISFALSPKKALGSSKLARVGLSLGDLAKSFRLSGTLAKPALAIDPRGLTITIGKALGGMAFLGPAGLLAPFVDISLGDKNPCVEAIEAIRQGAEVNQDQEPREEVNEMEETTDESRQERKGPLRSIMDIFLKK
jgi:uncharacterized protein involved in outer membrane biogenesis